MRLHIGAPDEVSPFSVRIHPEKQAALVPGGVRTNFLTAKTAQGIVSGDGGLYFGASELAQWAPTPTREPALHGTLHQKSTQQPKGHHAAIQPIALNDLLDELTASRTPVSVAPEPEPSPSLPNREEPATESTAVLLPRIPEIPLTLTIDDALPITETPSTFPAYETLLTIENIVAEESPLVPTREESHTPEPPQAQQPELVLKPLAHSQQKKRSPRLPRGTNTTFKGTAIFAAFALAILLPLHAVNTLSQVRQAQAAVEASEGASKNAAARAAAFLADRQFAQADATMANAEHSFARASETLASTEQELLGLSMLIPSVGRKVRSAKAVLAAGEACAQAAQTITAGFQALEARTTGGPASALVVFDRFVGRALPQLQSAAQSIEQVDVSVLPVEKREAFLAIKHRIGATALALAQFHQNAPALEAFLGLNTQERYLVFFQNTTEMRGTGGFWGSVAEVDMLDGKFTRMSVPPGGTYAMQGQLTAQVEAPNPLQILRARFELQDANWFPHFPASAKKALWFYEKGGGPTADGVIAINSSFAAKLIDAIGPLTLPSGATIDGENFLFETQKHVELDYDKESNTPKAFVGELVSALLTRLSTVNNADLVRIGELFTHALASRDIQLYHRDPSIQSTLSANGWAGEIRQTTGDYLLVNHTNVGGGKTDGLIEEHVALDSVARADGSLENTLTITRENHSIASALFSGKNNVDFVRVFVPHGSTLLTMEGNEPPQDSAFESTEGLATDTDLLAHEQGAYTAEHTFVGSAFGKTVFGAWTQTKPGEVSTLTIRYRTPTQTIPTPSTTWKTRVKETLGIPTASSHTFFWQAQSGSEYRALHYRFHPGTWQPRYTTEANALTLEARERDAYFGALLLPP